MSCFSARGLGALTAALLLLGACGFRPLYAPEGNGGAMEADLAAVRIAPIADRTGQQMHNLLRDSINPYGQPADPRYTLRVDLTESTRNLGIRRDETATRANLSVRARYRLIERGSNRVVLNDRARSTNSYDILDNEYATLVAEDDARERALRQLSYEIRRRLAVHFSEDAAER